jgi:pentatricopeptide repeat protein
MQSGVAFYTSNALYLRAVYTRCIAVLLLVQIYETMITTDMEITPAIRTIMMSACAHLGQFERALNLMDELEMAQQLPNVRTFNVLLLAASTSPLWMKVSSSSTANIALEVHVHCVSSSVHLWSAGN